MSTPAVGKTADAPTSPTPTGTADDDKATSARTWRFFLSLLRPYLWQIVLGALLGIVATLTGLWTPRIVESVIDHLAVGSPISGDITLFAVLTAIGLVTVLLQWGMLTRAGEMVVYDVRAAIVQRLLRGHVPAISARPTADLVSRASADAPLLQLTLASGFVSFVTAATGVIGAIVFMGVIDALMLGITLGALVVLGILMGVVMPIAGRERAKAQEAVGEMSSQLDSSVRALRTIKVLGAEGTRSAAVLERAHRARRHGVKASWAEVAAYELGFGGMNIVSVVVLAIGAYRVSQGYMSIAALVAFFMYVGNFVMPLMSLADGFATIQSGLAASKRISEIEDIAFEEPELVAAGVAATGRAARLAAEPSDAPVLEFDGVTARYEDDEPDVLRGFTLSIPRRGHVALVGPAGAGKSSAMSLALRFLTPRQGTVRLAGVPYEDLTFAQVRDHFAYVEQDPAVLPGTVRDNLAVARPDATDEELYAALDAMHLGDAIRELPDGLDTDLVPSTMTGGARQRLALARAVLRDADVLLLDEVTSQVSGRTETAVHAAIVEASRRGAVITIAHRIDTLKDADLVVVMEGGGVRATGTHAELAASDALYQELTGSLRINDGA
ncbi:ABC transporter ATP-binding protein [Xylanimonas protaetiae]|uniref:ABC transporter ATP-binding protein n=1 Tax=Xylanimonas protaetiae TaxID=2509457 RepID=A0A4P6F869_9MICO|nr:ABC transporter ATP-binding protein [Xylanimonas protaetiae]QAY70499.1 ABC transporter ATP-binding protein [Xylanimonas protaetiae]